MRGSRSDAYPGYRRVLRRGIDTQRRQRHQTCTHPAGCNQINLALEYAEDTRLAIEQANARGNLLSPSVNTLYNWLNRAQGQIKNEHFERCLQYVQKLENEIVGGTWTVDEFNDPGRLVMYSRNLYWRCDQLLLDEAN